MTASSQVGFTMASPGEKERCLGEVFSDWGSQYQKYVKGVQEFIHQELKKSEANAVRFINCVKQEGIKVQSELSIVRQKNISLEAQVEILKQGNEDGDGQIKELQQLNTTLQKKIKDLQKENASLHSIQMEVEVHRRTEDVDKIVADLESQVKEGEQRFFIIEGKLKESRKANADLSKILSRVFGGPAEHIHSSVQSLNQEGREIPQSSGTINVEDCPDQPPVHPVANCGKRTDQKNQCKETTKEDATKSGLKSKPSQNQNELTNGNKRKAKNGSTSSSTKRAKSVASSQPSESNGQLQDIVNEMKVETDVEVVFHRKPSEASHAAKRIFEECLCSSDYRRNIALQKLVFENQDRKIVRSLISLVLSETTKNYQVKLPRLRLVLNLVKGLLQNSDLNLEAYTPELIKSVLKSILEPNSTFLPPSGPSEWGSYWTFRNDTAPLLAALCQQSRLPETTEEAVKTLTAVLMDSTAPLESIHGAIVGLGEFGDQVVQVQLLPRIREIGEMIKSHSNSAGASLSKVDQLAIFFAEAAIEKAAGPLILSSSRPPVGIEEYRRDFGYFGQVLFQYVKTNQWNAPEITQLYFC